LFFFFFFTFSSTKIFFFQNVFFLASAGISLLVLGFVSCVAETNRAPFDLAEGESELVSGFNVEYGGIKFSLIFIAEYANIL